MAAGPSLSPIIFIQDSSLWTLSTSCLYLVAMYLIIFQHGVRTSLWSWVDFPVLVKFCFGWLDIVSTLAVTYSLSHGSLYVSIFLWETQKLVPSTIAARPLPCCVSCVLYIWCSNESHLLFWSFLLPVLTGDSVRALWMLRISMFILKNIS